MGFLTNCDALMRAVVGSTGLVNAGRSQKGIGSVIGWVYGGVDDQMDASDWNGRREEVIE